MAKLKDILATRHPSYIENINLWNLLADSLSGKGGFLPPIDQPKWGKVAPYWDNSGIDDSYITPFTREKLAHFSQRIRTTSYINHFKRIEDTILGFMKRSPIEIKDLPPDLEEWRKNADALGHSLDDLIMGPIASSQLTFGYSLSTVDRPDEAAQNAAVALSAYVSCRDIRSAIAWGLNEITNQLAWIRFEDQFIRWVDPLQEPDQGIRWTLWTTEEVQCWEYIGDGPNKMEDATVVEGFPKVNPTKQLPVVVGYYSGVKSYFEIPESPLQSCALLGMWLFNRQSEETDLYRQRGFPLLCWPVKDNQKPKAFNAGTDNAVPYPSEGNPPIYLSPDGSTATNYDTIIKRGESQIYEQSRTDFSRSGAQVESGVSRAIRFQAMNANLVSFGQSLCTIARTLCEQAIRWNSSSPESIDAKAMLADTIFESSDNYDVEELDRELALLQTGLELGLGPTAEKCIRKAARDRLVTLKDEELDQSNREIELMAATEINAQTAGQDIPPVAHMQEVPIDELMK